MGRVEGPSRIVLVGAASAIGRRWGVNDDRVLWDEATLLAGVADASGPEYGGYHAPFAVDPALELLVAAFGSAQGDRAARLHESVFAADAFCRRQERRLRDAHAVAKESCGDLIRASLIAADSLRPAAWAAHRGRSHAHHFTSLTALTSDSGRVLIEQCGSTRAYLLRAGNLTHLAPDHALSSFLRAQGRLQEAVLQRGAVLAALGAGDHLASVAAQSTIERGDRIALVSDGVWDADAGETLVRALIGADGARSIESIVHDAAADSRDDATALVVAVS